MAEQSFAEIMAQLTCLTEKVAELGNAIPATVSQKVQSPSEVVKERPCQNTDDVCFVSFSLNMMDGRKRRHVCRECRQEFTRASGLRKHNECVHLRITWTCKLCAVVHCSRSNLVRHLRLQHADVPNPPRPVRDPVQPTNAEEMLLPANREVRVVRSVRVHDGDKKGLNQDGQQTSPNVRTRERQKTRELGDGYVDRRQYRTKTREKATSSKEDQRVTSKGLLLAMRFSPLVDTRDEPGEVNRDEETQEMVDQWVRQMVTASTVEDEQRISREILGKGHSIAIPKKVGSKEQYRFCKTILNLAQSALSCVRDKEEEHMDDSSMVANYTVDSLAENSEDERKIKAEEKKAISDRKQSSLKSRKRPRTGS